MAKQRDTSTDTSRQTPDTSAAPEAVVQPIEQQPLVDTATGLPIGDNTVSNPVIINR